MCRRPWDIPVISSCHGEAVILQVNSMEVLHNKAFRDALTTLMGDHIVRPGNVPISEW